MSEETKIAPGPLQEQLSSKADAQLKSELNKLFGPIERMCYDSCFIPYAHKSTLIGYAAHSTNDCSLTRLVNGVREIVEASLLNQNRQRYTSDFIAKVESLQSQVEELKSQIQQ